METKNAKNRSSQNGESYNIRNSKDKSGIVGDASSASSKHGYDPIAVSGEDSYQSNSIVSGGKTTSELSGKIVSQLVEETEKQLAYHKQQTELLENRLHELKQISPLSTENTIEPDH